MEGTGSATIKRHSLSQEVNSSELVIWNFNQVVYNQTAYPASLKKTIRWRMHSLYVSLCSCDLSRFSYHMTSMKEKVILTLEMSA